MTLEELTLLTRLHDWSESYSPRVLIERLDLIKGLSLLPQKGLAEIIRPLHPVTKGTVIANIEAYALRSKE